MADFEGGEFSDVLGSMFGEQKPQEPQAPAATFRGGEFSSTLNTLFNSGAEEQAMAPFRQAAEEASHGVAGSRGPAAMMMENSIPFASTLFGVNQRLDYQSAKKNIAEGIGTDEDRRKIALFEQKSRDEANEGTGMAIARGVAKIPAIVGEGYIAGGANPLGMVSAAPGAIVPQLGLGLAKTAVSTAMMPSMYLEDAQARAERQGGSYGDLKNVAPALALGTLNNLVLGQIKAPTGGIPTFAGRVAARTAIGMGEQQIADMVAGATGLSEKSQQSTGYGLLPDILAGKDGTLKRAAVQIVTFGIFAGLHSMHSDAKDMSQAFVDATKELKDAGLPPEAAGAKLATITDAANDAMTNKPGGVEKLQKLADDAPQGSAIERLTTALTKWHEQYAETRNSTDPDNAIVAADKSGPQEWFDTGSKINGVGFGVAKFTDRQGREITFNLEPATGGGVLVRAFHGDKEVGNVTFNRDPLLQVRGGHDIGQNFLAGMVEVKPEYRRNGISNAMYDYAKRMLDAEHPDEATRPKILPSASQTEDGKSIWRSNAERALGENNRLPESKSAEPPALPPHTEEATANSRGSERGPTNDELQRGQMRADALQALRDAEKDVMGENTPPEAPATPENAPESERSAAQEAESPPKGEIAAPERSSEVPAKVAETPPEEAPKLPPLTMVKPKPAPEATRQAPVAPQRAPEPPVRTPEQLAKNKQDLAKLKRLSPEQLRQVDLARRSREILAEAGKRVVHSEEFPDNPVPNQIESLLQESGVKKIQADDLRMLFRAGSTRMAADQFAKEGRKVSHETVRKNAKAAIEAIKASLPEDMKNAKTHEELNGLMARLEHQDRIQKLQEARLEEGMAGGPKSNAAKVEAARQVRELKSRQDVIAEQIDAHYEDMDNERELQSFLKRYGGGDATREAPLRRDAEQAVRDGVQEATAFAAAQRTEAAKNPSGARPTPRSRGVSSLKQAGEADASVRSEADSHVLRPPEPGKMIEALEKLVPNSEAVKGAKHNVALDMPYEGDTPGMRDAEHASYALQDMTDAEFKKVLPHLRTLGFHEPFPETRPGYWEWKENSFAHFDRPGERDPWLLRNARQWEEEAKSVFRSLSSKTMMGADPEAIKAVVKYLAAKLVLGGYSFAKFAKEIIDAHGEAWRPHLHDIWEKATTLAKDHGWEPLPATGIKNAEAEKQRAAAGLPPLPAADPVGHSYPELRDAVADIAKNDPARIDALIEKQKRNPEPLTDLQDAMLLHRLNEVRNQYAGSTRMLVEMRKPNSGADAIDVNRVESANRILRDKLQEITDVTNEAGTINARGLAARRMMANEDFSLAAMLQTKEAAVGRPLTPEEQQKVADQSDKIKDLQDKLKAAEDQLKNVRGKKADGESGDQTAQRVFDSKEFQAWQKSNADAGRAKGEFRNEIKADTEQREPLTKRFEDLILRLRQNFVISSPKTLGKIAMASLLRMTFTPAEEAVGSVFKRLPGLAQIAKAAERQGQGFSAAREGKAFMSGFTDGLIDGYKTMLHGKSDLDVQHAGADQWARNRWLDFVGELHAALKAPAVRNEYTRSVLTRLSSLAEAGKDITDPGVFTRVLADAYKDSQRAKFQQDNKLASGINRLIGTLRSPDAGRGAKSLGFALDMLMPVRKIPTNLVAEAFEYATGTVSGGTKAVQALVNGVGTLKPAEAELIMRQLKKGSLGAAVMLAGYLLPQAVGGFFTDDDKKRLPGDVKQGELRTPLGDVPNWMLHNPLLEIAQFGATIRRVAETFYSKSKGGGEKGSLTGAAVASLGLLEEVPMARETLDLSKLWDANKRGQFFGTMLQGLVVPQVFSWMANGLDVRKGDTPFVGETVKRAPVGPMQNLQAGIPYARQQLPERVPARR